MVWLLYDAVTLAVTKKNSKECTFNFRAQSYNVMVICWFEKASFMTSLIYNALWTQSFDLAYESWDVFHTSFDSASFRTYFHFWSTTLTAVHHFHLTGRVITDWKCKCCGHRCHNKGGFQEGILLHLWPATSSADGSSPLMCSTSLV